jgi:hypothetical protein
MSIFEGAVTSFTIHKKKLRTTRASLTRSLPLFPFLFKDPYALRAGYTFFNYKFVKIISNICIST